MKNLIVSIACVLFIGTALLAQSDYGSLSGIVIDNDTREPLPFSNVLIVGTSIGGTTDINGEFLIEKAPLGYVKVQASFVGYNPVSSDDILITKGKPQFVQLELKSNAENLEEVVIKADLFREDKSRPVSMQTLGVAEIEKNPGGNRDISKVIQSLPGVAANPGFRNDIVIRGGSPSENRFFLDGVEVPVINHFQTQGSSGGPVGILNANLIREVEFASGAFPVNKGNALSSVISFKQAQGNKEKLHTRFTVGSSDVGLTVDGPIGEKTTYIFSVRQSYLQFLFSALKLPFLPTFNDYQLNVRHQINDKNFVSVISLGALDRFKLNQKVNDGVTDADQLKRNEYLLGNLPIQEQWNYTFGVVYDNYFEGGKNRFVLSRNMWNNTSFKYFENDDSSPDNLLFDYESEEIENKFRFERTGSVGSFDYLTGLGFQQAKYTNATLNSIATPNGIDQINFSSELIFYKYAWFGQLTKRFFESRLVTSLSTRVDGNTFSDQMANPLNQFSPRLSASYSLLPKLSLNGNVGRYFQIPSYTILGYRNNNGELVNKANNVKYIQADHYVLGLGYKPNEETKITLEGFYKDYDNYPMSVRDSISLANLGSDFGVIGNEEVTSTSEGRAYGFELLAQKRSFKSIYGILAYTFVRSEFKDKNEDYIPSSWDNRHILTFTGGNKFKKNWEVGMKFRLIGGRPYTPYNREASALIQNYDTQNAALLDYNQLNSKRYEFYNQLDIRVDKTFYWNKVTLNLYLDIQNIYGAQSQEQPILIAQTDENGNRIINPDQPDSYLMEELENSSGTVLPTIGIIFDF